MYCVNCGKEIGEGQAFCSECGASQNRQTQPAGGQTNMMGVIPDYLVLSIISLFFFLPLGIVAVVFSSKVKNYVMMGDYQSARDYSNKAKIFSLISIGISIALIVIVLILGAAIFSSGYYNYYY